ncbi:hypothetical protein NBRC3293_0840 [Gluconobacter oxydans NBRC 3293]|uniref:Uncharacterized protein n=1 Tax=Gluconobacter oxydans NBRC 3293 TaxID=1315969 RepID=A0A829WT30_GLUOY|nr:hypothetical protein NBRC3293_0840 [Gluconobacter oxydans NBRC 3293]
MKKCHSALYCGTGHRLRKEGKRLEIRAPCGTLSSMPYLRIGNIRFPTPLQQSIGKHRNSDGHGTNIRQNSIRQSHTCLL